MNVSCQKTMNNIFFNQNFLNIGKKVNSLTKNRKCHYTNFRLLKNCKEQHVLFSQLELTECSNILQFYLSEKIFIQILLKVTILKNARVLEKKNLVTNCLWLF